MNYVWIALIIIHLISLGCLGVYLVRLSWHMKKFKLEENKYTKLFGIIRFEHMIVFYIAFIAVFTVTTVIFTPLLL